MLRQNIFCARKSRDQNGGMHMVEIFRIQIIQVRIYSIDQKGLGVPSYVHTLSHGHYLVSKILTFLQFYAKREAHFSKSNSAYLF